MNELIAEKKTGNTYKPHVYSGSIINFDQQFRKRLLIFDRMGVLTVKQNNSQYPRYVYNPVGIANYALFRYNDLVRETNVFNAKTEPMVAILNNLSWLIKNRVDKEDMSFWYYHYPFNHGCRPPWRSAMAQGLVLSLLVRVYPVTSDPQLLRLAKRVANSLKKSVSEGGFLFTDSNENYWYEEYMGNFGHVLNGFIFAILGIHDYSLFIKDPEFDQIFEKCILTLRKNLKCYDLQRGPINWTVYDLKDRQVCNVYYHSLHCELLRQLHEIVGQDFLFHYYQRWTRYLQQTNVYLVNLYRAGSALLRIAGKSLHE